MCLSVSTKEPSQFTKKEDRFNKVYNSDGEPGTFYDMKDIEYTQDFDEYALPYVLPPDAGIFFSDYEGKKSVAEVGGKSNNDLYHTVHVEIPLYQV